MILMSCWISSSTCRLSNRMTRLFARNTLVAILFLPTRQFFPTWRWSDILAEIRFFVCRESLRSRFRNSFDGVGKTLQPTNSVRYFLTVPASRLFERSNALLDRESDETRKIANAELLHHSGAVGLHGLR